MKSKTFGIILLFIIISLAALLLILWFVDFSRLSMPTSIPVLQLRTYGVLILTSYILIFIFLQRSLLKTDKQTSILKLVTASTIVAFISLLLYQTIRQLIVLRGQYSYNVTSILLSSAIPTLIFILVATSIAVDVKKIKGIWRHIPTLVLLILLLVSKQYLNQLEW